MADNTMDHTRLSEAADAIGRHVADNPHSTGELTAEHVQMLLEAGIPGATIAELLRAEGVEEDEVAGYALASGTAQAPSIVVGTICVGTCRNMTIVVGCERSILAQGSA